MAEDSIRELCKIANEDIICSLCDDFLVKILSFLPTKNAACTSVLSKRWRDKHHWTSALTNLDLDDSVMLYSIKKPRPDGKFLTPEECKDIFGDFVERCFNLRTDAHPMELFRLKISGNYNSSRVSAWISSAVRARVEEMLIFSQDTELSLCSCETLVVLNVTCPRIAFLVDPSIVCFPRLKVLHLDCLHPMHDNACIERVLSGSPILEELKIEMEGCKSINFLNVRSGSLKRLMMQFLPDDDYLEEVDDLPPYRKLTLDTPKLEVLKLTDSASEELIISHRIPSLVEATLCLSYSNVLTKTSDDYAEMVVGFLEQISDVEILVLSDFTMDTLKDAYDLDGLKDLPTFWYLTRLEVEASGAKRMILHHILQCCASLEVLILEGILETPQWREPPNPPPYCLSTCLEVIEFNNFEGKLADIKMVKYFLWNAKVLKKMAIRFEREIDDSKEDVVKRLSNSPKGSKYDYQIEFLP